MKEPQPPHNPAPPSPDRSDVPTGASAPEGQPGALPAPLDLDAIRAALAQATDPHLGCEYAECGPPMPPCVLSRHLASTVAEIERLRADGAALDSLKTSP